MVEGIFKEQRVVHMAVRGSSSFSNDKKKKNKNNFKKTLNRESPRLGKERESASFMAKRVI